jgi:(p)ppGpp synthase/HD superfamily hydrolase
LHDSVEDTDLTLTELYKIVPIEVACLVEMLTRKKSGPLASTYESYIDSLTGSENAMIIKLADLEHNMDRSRGPVADNSKGAQVLYASLMRRYERAHKCLTNALNQRRQP